MQTNLGFTNLDALDQKILKILVKNARISVSDLSQQVGLSKTPCHNRIRRLEREGYIKGYKALLDPVKLKLDHIAFVEVKLSSTRLKALEEFNDAALACTEIEECHMLAASFDYLLKVRSRDVNDYRQFLGETLVNLPHVQSTSTYVALQAVKDQTTQF